MQEIQKYESVLCPQCLGNRKFLQANGRYDDCKNCNKTGLVMRKIEHIPSFSKIPILAPQITSVFVNESHLVEEIHKEHVAKKRGRPPKQQNS